MSKQTIPRLELLSSLLSSRLAESVKKAFNDVKNIDSVTYWSDSTVALSWIRSTNKEYKQFVENRIREIRRLTSPELWRYCPTKQNPADIASRGATATQLVADQTWWHGPDFLKMSIEHWPDQSFDGQIDDSELKSSQVKMTTSTVNVNVNITQVPNLEAVLKASNYSRVVRLLRVTAYVLRFMNNLKSSVAKSDPTAGFITTEEVKAAEMLWIKESQATIVKMEKYQKMKQSLNLFEDNDGFIRCHGRIERSSLPYDAKFPMLLPSDHTFTKLVVLRNHQDVMHNGVGETLTQLRSKFWIVKGRQVVKKILSRCVVCRKLEGKSYGVPLAPPLPDYRLDNVAAFTRVGVDYAGPLFVKNIYTGTNDMHKTYIVLYTCACSRAVHLDLTPDATTEAFIRSLKRFIGRRGIPSTMISDNGKTFKSKDLKKFASSNGIKWINIVERSPWWGGFYERMVRSVKRCLKKVLGTARLTYEELLTLLMQVEGVLNSRPLTYIYEDGDEPLTPSHLLLGKRLLSSPQVVKTNEIAGLDDSRKAAGREKHLRTVLMHFWRRWQREYLTQLREYHRPRQTPGPPINVGDTVTIQEDKVNRLNWNIGTIEKLLTGKDGNVRAVLLRTLSKDGKPIQMRRPLQKLFPVELKSDQNKEPELPITFVKHAKHETLG